ncbi:hypothetical protein LXL04_007056 [Taraxacum kok-saghyz]
MVFSYFLSSADKYQSPAYTLVTSLREKPEILYRFYEKHDFLRIVQFQLCISQHPTPKLFLFADTVPPMITPSRRKSSVGMEFGSKNCKFSISMIGKSECLRFIAHFFICSLPSSSLVLNSSHLFLTT